MQIFALDPNPAWAAEALCDKHINSQIKESVQILSAAFYLNGKWEHWMCKPAWLHNRLVRWAAQNGFNAAWLALHASSIASEYWRRYGQHHVPVRHHAYTWMADAFLVKIPGFADIWRLHDPFVQAFPEAIHREDPVQGYRDYYHTKAFAKWNNGRKPPVWW